MFKPAPKVSRGIAAIVLAMVLGTAAVVWTVITSRNAVKLQVLEDNSGKAHHMAAAVTAEMEGHLRVIDGISRRPTLIQAVAEGRWEDLGLHLRDLRAVDPHLGSAAAFDATGKLWARDPVDQTILGRDFSHRDYFRGAVSARGPYLSDVFEQAGTPRAVVVAFAVPISNPSGELLGVLQSTHAVGEFSLLTDQVASQDQSSVVLFDRSAHAVSPEFNPNSSFEDLPPVARALSGFSGVGEFELPGIGGSQLTAYAPAKEIGWAVLVHKPTYLAFRPVGQLTRNLAGVLALSLLGGVVAAFAVTRLIGRLDRLRREASAIVRSMGDAVLITDSDWRIMWGNPALEKLSGWPSDEVRGRTAHDVYRVFDERGEQVVLKSKVLNGAAAATGNLTLESKDGNRVPIQTTTAPIQDEKGTRLGYVIVGRDVSREREIDALKSTLVSTVSHELRTPLTMIRGFSELLLSRELDEEHSSKALTEINVSAERLSRLIDDLLSVSRIESGRMKLDVSIFDLRTIVEEVIRPFSTREGSRFQVEVQELQVRADKDRLMQILTNLVSNAVKYSDTGSPIIVTAHGSEASAEIAVVDQGIGMSEAEMASAFEMFSRVDRPEVKDAGGTGLGLHITRSLVEAHGGQIWIENQPGGGTRFAFTLPLATTGADAKEKTREASAERGLQ